MKALWTSFASKCQKMSSFCWSSLKRSRYYRSLETLTAETLSSLSTTGVFRLQTSELWHTVWVSALTCLFTPINCRLWMHEIGLTASENENNIRRYVWIECTRKLGNVSPRLECRFVPLCKYIQEGIMQQLERIENTIHSQASRLIALFNKDEKKDDNVKESIKSALYWRASGLC